MNAKPKVIDSSTKANDLTKECFMVIEFLVNGCQVRRVAG